ncbi:hypothetical protein SUGI_0310690 [Cryptomeria japonica]|uniref:small GTPase LIP1 n=1 Tax=Cryptomeria japonica TaxID=3369 RepID=UPI0024089A95|nr:small GTPase LIP1 [Cryptomeria japonica]GLJ17786.1 hypothetical protein SUGI_0310690 [Cryptomeria japonica]
MFRRDKDRDRDRFREQNGFSPCGQVRVLVVGDSGVGKSSIVQFIVNGVPVSNIQQTVGCKVGIKLMTYGGSGSSSSTSSKGEKDREFFVELWDVSGHERYKDCRSLFYSQINGIIFVHDLSQRKTKSNLQKWAAEIANLGTFSAPLGISNIAGIPVPFLVIGNKADIAPKDCGKGSSSNLVDAARQWVEKQGLLSPSDELPLTETFPRSGGLVTVAKEGRLDKEAVNKFFITLIKRRYYPEDLPVSVQQSWVSPTASKNIYHARQRSNDDNSIQNFIGLNGDDYRYNSLPPLPAQRTLTPPPTSYPQQPMLFSDDYSVPRSKASASSETTNVKSKRADILV